MIPAEVLLTLLRDPRAAFPAPSPQDHAEAMLRAHVLRVLSRALVASGERAMLVKGAALALTVYPRPASRPMSDVDLLIPKRRERAVLDALARAGLSILDTPARPRSRALLGETQLVARAGSMRMLVELHDTLDKIVPRPIDVEAIQDRASPAPELPGLFVPSPEDHALFVALHAAGHELRHDIALLDLELLFRRGLDHRALLDRARAFRLETALFVVLSTLRALGAASVPPELCDALRRGPLRRAALSVFYDVGGFPVARGAPALGARWVLGQTPLRDDLGAWGRGLLRYGALRALDRLPPAATLPAVSYHVPLWVRALLAVDRVAGRAAAAREGLRDELLLAFIPEADRAALTGALYARQRTYLPGGHRFESGLFTWEKRALDAPSFPRSGRVLVGAAGAGREVKALLDRGYEVTAFDPCDAFVEGARPLFEGERATFFKGSYDDLVDAALGLGGPLASLRDLQFDAVILGWGSLSHVSPAASRLALLRAARALAPRAVVLASFMLRHDTSAPSESKGRLRDALRRAFSALGAPGVSEAGDNFFPDGGFFSYLSPDELPRAAFEAGYEVVLFEEGPYPHALLAPLAVQTGRGGPA